MDPVSPDSLETQRLLERVEAGDRLLMRSFEALSYQEVAYLLEVDAATARKRHGRALLRLTQILAEHGLTESQL